MALTDIKVRAAKPTDKQYKLTDGGGMHLLVHPNGSKYWRLQYRYEGKQKMLALGVYPEITLADARVRRDEARKLLANGVDPGDKKKNDKVEQSKARTFKEVAIEWHGTNKKGTVAKLAMRQPFVLFKGLTFQKLCLPGAFRPGDHHNKMLRPGLCVVHASPQYL